MAQISIEDAFPTFRKRLNELFEENLLLRAQVDVLERQLAAAQQQTTPAAEGHPEASAPAAPDPGT
ncbi:hypothetical protein ABZ733_07125 [Streptomyces longwoodensis]|uniref:hypothetical protein n=1 Tax=Streptomyces longwoodensis TaxID=68231 RepID=UPI0033E4C73B